MNYFIKTPNALPDGRDVALLNASGKVLATGTESGNLGDIRPALLASAGLTWADIGPAPIAAPAPRSRR
jgi:hypothetical protein